MACFAHYHRLTENRLLEKVGTASRNLRRISDFRETFLESTSLQYVLRSDLSIKSSFRPSSRAHQSRFRQDTSLVRLGLILALEAFPQLQDQWRQQELISSGGSVGISDSRVRLC